MTRVRDRERAIQLRLKGESYSAIREKLNVSKSTLSNWLRDFPLSREHVNELRALSPKRIEKFRNTMRLKREKRLKYVYDGLQKSLGKLNKREVLIAGFFLYWGEGGKTKPYSITLTNTDPYMIKFYLKWLKRLKVSFHKVKIRLYLYSDMNLQEEIKFWSRITSLQAGQFLPVVVKETRAKRNYQGFGHGTCNVIVDDRDISEYVLQGIRLLRNMNCFT